MKRRTFGILAALLFLGVLLFLGSIGEDLSESGVDTIPTGAVILDESSKGKGLHESTIKEITQNESLEEIK